MCILSGKYYKSKWLCVAVFRYLIFKIMWLFVALVTFEMYFESHKKATVLILMDWTCEKNSI